jgi:hypothetical protein
MGRIEVIERVVEVDEQSADRHGGENIEETDGGWQAPMIRTPSSARRGAGENEPRPDGTDESCQIIIEISVHITDISMQESRDDPTHP